MTMFSFVRNTLSLVVATVTASSLAQQARPAAKPAAVSVVMLSDLHFDPFHDPAKLAKLRAAGAAQWSAILAEPESATQAAEFAKLNATCRLRGSDSTSQLLQSSLAAAHAQAPEALFVTVSGDLMAHAFDCRFKALAPKATDADYSAFAYKTVTYVALELRRTFGKTPVYVALGNNDSGCGDYRESSGSPFLRALSQSLAGGFAPGSEGPAAGQSFSESGSYSVRLPAPIKSGRLIVLQNLFLARTYKDCEDKQSAGVSTAMITWLRTELEHARTAHEQVWVMAHIPPGVDVYSTVRSRSDVCGGKSPTMFLGDGNLAETLTNFADVVRLAIFAHTHNDEIHLLRSSDFTSTGDEKLVATKLVPSVSPINGNLPSFLLVEVEAGTANLKDYRTIMASNQSGINAKWTEEYRFSSLYGAGSFTPAVLDKLLGGFSADQEGVAQASADYQQKFFVGGGIGSIGVHLVWPRYVCAMEHHTEASYRSCVCPVKQSVEGKE